MFKIIFGLFVSFGVFSVSNAGGEYGESYGYDKSMINDKSSSLLLRLELIEIYGLFWDAIISGWTSGDTANLEAIGPSIMTKNYRFKSSVVETGDWFESRDDFIDNYIPAIIDLCIGTSTKTSCDFAMQSMSSAFKLIHETDGLITMEIGITFYLRGKELLIEEFEERRIRFRQEDGKWKLSQDENIGTSLP